MNVKVKAVFVSLMLAAAVFAQQPNSANHSMTINGVDGPPYPILNVPVRTNLPALFTISGAPNQPYAIFQGLLGTGTTFVLNSIVDLALQPFPSLVIDGFQQSPNFNTGPAGSSSFQVNVPAAGTGTGQVPLGLQLSLQCLMGDPFNAPYVVALTAATRITVTQGPTVTFFSPGDSSTTTVNMTGMTFPFYGASYSSFSLDSNGYLTFGSTITSDYTPTPTMMVAGPRRIAPFWTDLVCPGNSVKMILDANPGPFQNPYCKIEWNGVQDLGYGTPHTFSVLMRSDGYLEIYSSGNNNPGNYDTITGIGPGQNIAQVQKNFVGAQPPGSSVGHGILTHLGGLQGTNNQAFFEWFGNSTMPYYGNGYDNNFDLFNVLIRFQPNPIVPVPLPAGANEYQVY